MCKLRRSTVIAVFLISQGLGCQSFNLKKDIPWHTEKDEPEKNVVRMVASWKETALAKPGQPAMRGFAGRVYFYNRDGEPVTVQGRLVVYAYENRQGPTFDDTPNRRFVFTPEQLASHYSHGPIGPSYSFWIPFDELGGEEKRVELVPTFVPNVGNTVVGAQAKLHLPGKTPRPESGTADREANAIRPVDYRQTPGEFYDMRHSDGMAQRAPSSTASSQHTLETTIDIPPIVRKRLGKVPMVPHERARHLQGNVTRQPGVADNSPRRPWQNDAATLPMFGVQSVAGPWSGPSSNPTSPTQMVPQREGAIPPALATMSQPSTHFAHERFRAPRGPAVRRLADPPRRQPFPSGQLSFHHPNQPWPPSARDLRFESRSFSAVSQRPPWHASR